MVSADRLRLNLKTLGDLMNLCLAQTSRRLNPHGPMCFGHRLPFKKEATECAFSRESHPTVKSDYKRIHMAAVEV